MNLKNVRNIVLVGHAGSGKTSLAEACLHGTGATNRLGSVTDGSSILDFTDEEKEKHHSHEAAACTVSVGDTQINIVDTPGSPDFCGHAIPALAAGEIAVVVVSATAGIEVNTRKMFERAREFGLGVMFVINKIDAENVNVAELTGRLQETFGQQCLPVTLPADNARSVVSCFGSGKPDFGDIEEAKTAVLEAIVGVDDELMEKYLGGEVSEDQVRAVAARAVASGEFFPICYTNAREEVGVKEFLDAVVELGPNPTNGLGRKLKTDDGEVDIGPETTTDFIAQVFKVSTDPKSNIKYCYLRVLSGKIGSDSTLGTSEGRKKLRSGPIHRMKGGEHTELTEGVAGDVIALAKLDLSVGETMFTGAAGEVAMPRSPQPMYSLAVDAKSRGDEDKIAAAFKRFSEEDVCFTVERNPITHETVINGVGDMHLRTIMHRLATQFKIELDTRPPKIPYRETIVGSAHDVDYTHKKQTGGAGQYGKVVINVEPNERGAGYEFVDKIFGGAIDQSYRPSVDKGIKAVLKEGVLAGYPVVDVRVELIDGKTHPVDSKDIAFQIAGRGAFKEAFMKSKPILLEPIVNLEVTAPVDNLGDLQGDIASRRGQPVGQEMLPGQVAVLKAKVPLAEVADYHSRLSSITGGQGSFVMELSHYEQVPANVQQKIVADAEKEKAKDRE